jgi:hypothetical protein
VTQIVIPLSTTPNQTITAILDGAAAQITLTTTDYGLFADVIYDGVSVALGRLCLDRTDINPNRYLGLPQMLAFADLQGITDPVYTGFSSRYLLLYGDS